MKNIKEANNFLGYLFNMGLKCTLFLGALILGNYFIFINYIPVINFQSAIHILFIIAFIGFLVLFFTNLSFIWAPYIWLGLLQKRDSCILIVGKKHAKSIQKAYLSGYIDLPLEVRSKIFYYYVISISLYLLLIWTSIFLNSHKVQIALIFVSLFSFLYYASIFSSNEKQKDKPHSLFSRKYMSHKTRARINIFIVSVTAASMLFLGICFALKIVSSTHISSSLQIVSDLDTLKIVVLTLLFSVMLVTLTSACLLPFTQSLNINVWMLLMGFFSACIIFISLQAVGDGSRAIIHSLKLGGLHDVSIHVDNVGCKILEQNHYKIKCEDNQVSIVNNIDVLWRVGEYYIRFNNNDPKPKKLIIPANHVLGIITEDNGDNLNNS